MSCMQEQYACCTLTKYIIKLVLQVCTEHSHQIHTLYMATNKNCARETMNIYEPAIFLLFLSIFNFSKHRRLFMSLCVYVCLKCLTRKKNVCSIFTCFMTIFLNYNTYTTTIIMPPSPQKQYYDNRKKEKKVLNSCIF